MLLRHTLLTVCYDESEIASVQSVVKKRKRERRQKKRPKLFHQSKPFLIEKISSFFNSFCFEPWIFHFFHLSLFDRCTFLKKSVFVFVSFSAYALLNERTFFVSNYETRRCLRRRAKWCCRCCCPPPPPPREDDNNTEEEFYEDGSVTRAGVATTMKTTTTTMGIWRWWWEKAPRRHHHHRLTLLW